MIRRNRPTAPPAVTDDAEERQQLLAGFEQEPKSQQKKNQPSQQHTQQYAPPQQGAHPSNTLRLDAQDMAYLSTTLIPTGDPQKTDLNSLSATRTLHFTFYGTVDSEVPQYMEEIMLFSTPDPVMLCLELKRWNYAMFLPQENRAEGVVRVEYLALDKMDVSSKVNRLHRTDSDSNDGDGLGHAFHSLTRTPKPQAKTGLAHGQKAHLLILPYAANASLTPTTPPLPLNYSILALLLPSDNLIRWFYTPFLLSPLLIHLQRASPSPLITAQKSFPHGFKPHGRLHAFVREMFCAAVTFPESEDWRYAVRVGDYCPPVRDEEGAARRLEGNEFLHFSKWADDGEAGESEGRVSDDRYLERVERAERMVAGMVGLKIAEYLHIKRDFFKAFFEEVYRSDKPILDTPTANPTATANTNILPRAPSANSSTSRHRRASRRADTPFDDSAAPTRTGGRADGRGGAQPGWKKRVRTEHAHQVWLEREFEMKPSRAKMMVVGWRELGFLDETYFAHWVRKGGVFEGTGGGTARE